MDDGTWVFALLKHKCIKMAHFYTFCTSAYVLMVIYDRLETV